MTEQEKYKWNRLVEFVTKVCHASRYDLEVYGWKLAQEAERLLADITE